MSQVLTAPLDLVRLQGLLKVNAGLEPLVDADRPAIEIWATEASGELRRWLLVAIGERTVTVMNPANRYDRVLRQHGQVWIRPDALEFREVPLSTLRRQSRATWTLAQGAAGRRNAAAARERGKAL